MSKINLKAAVVNRLNFTDSEVIGRNFLYDKTGKLLGKCLNDITGCVPYFGQFNHIGLAGLPGRCGNGEGVARYGYDLGRQ